MKGLLIKDFNLLKVQKRFFFVIVLLAIVMSFSMEDASFIVGYLTFVIPSFAVSTIGYDEFDNGNAFLFTLPISRRGYVLEKYCFSLILGLGAAILGVLLSIGVGASNDPASILAAAVTAVIIFLAMAVVLSAMIPMQLKFGSEKGRVARIAIVGGLFVILLGLSKLIEFLDIDLSAVATVLGGLHAGLLISAAVGLVLLTVLLSMWISVRIMEKKEF